MGQGIQAMAQPPQPQIIIIREEKESLVSRGIGSVFAPFVFGAGAVGMLVGAIAGATQTGTGTGMVVGAFIGGVTVTTVATLGVKTIQFAVDAALNCTFFVLKLPFKVAAYLLDGAGHGLSYAYKAISGSNASQVKQESASDDNAPLEPNLKLA